MNTDASPYDPDRMVWVGQSLNRWLRLALVKHLPVYWGKINNSGVSKSGLDIVKLVGKLLTDHVDFDSAASGLYYAMLYTAEALLEALDLSFSSHRAVISSFGQYFAKTGKLDIRFHKALLAGFSQRQMGDYRFDSDLAQEDIDQMTLDASDFLKAARAWLELYGSGEGDESGK